MGLLLLAPATTTVELIPTDDLSLWSGPRVLFWIIGLMVITGALMMITRRNLIAAVMWLVGTFFGLAASYALLSAHFLAALQVLVYAGAIMVLFIFVVMVLNREEAEPWVWRGLTGKLVVGLPALTYLSYKLYEYAGRMPMAHPEAPPPEFGTVAAVGEILFTDYLFAFEAVSVLLLVAVIAAVVVARTHKQAVEATTPPPPEALSAPEGHA